MQRFAGKTAIVTGAGNGLGRGYAHLLAAEGANVVVNDYGGDTKGERGSGAAAETVVAEIRDAGGTAVADASDVATEGERVVATARDAFGGVHLVVNNAGIAGGGTIDTTPPEFFERMLAVHLGGTLAVTRAAWPILRDQGYGRIVNTSSGSVFGLPGTPAYITAKAAIFGLTRALAHDGRPHGIKANAIMPVALSRLTAMSAALAPIMEKGFPSAKVAPFVGALLDEAVPCSGETFVVGAGRAARVVLGTVPGLKHADSIESVLEHFDDALASDDLYVPPDAMYEVRYQCEQLGVDLSGLSAAAP